MSEYTSSEQPMSSEGRAFPTSHLSANHSSDCFFLTICEGLNNTQVNADADGCQKQSLRLLKIEFFSQIELWFLGIKLIRS